LSSVRNFLRSRLSLLLALAVFVVGFAGLPPAAKAFCTGQSGTITSYSDATYTTVVGFCRKLCCWTYWSCSGQTTIYRIEDINDCGIEESIWEDPFTRDQSLNIGATECAAASLSPKRHPVSSQVPGISCQALLPGAGRP
jgi:hypothetical protein